MGKNSCCVLFPRPLMHSRGIRGTQWAAQEGAVQPFQPPVVFLGTGIQACLVYIPLCSSLAPLSQTKHGNAAWKQLSMPLVPPSPRACSQVWRHICISWNISCTYPVPQTAQHNPHLSEPFTVKPGGEMAFSVQLRASDQTKHNHSPERLFQHVSIYCHSAPVQIPEKYTKILHHRFLLAVVWVQTCRVFYLTSSVTPWMVRHRVCGGRLRLM